MLILPRYTGTRDYTPFCTIRAAISFRESIGGENAIKEYNRTLAYEAATLLAKCWNTVVLEPKDMASAMIDVRFPSDDLVLATWVRVFLYAQQRLNTCKDKLQADYHEFLVVYQLPDSSIWCRLSAQMLFYSKLTFLTVQILGII